MNLPHFVEAGDYIVSPRRVARLRRVRAQPGAAAMVCILLDGREGVEDELDGADADRIFELFRRLASAGAPALPDPAPAGAPLDASDSRGDRPVVVRHAVRDEPTGTE